MQEYSPNVDIPTCLVQALGSGCLVSPEGIYRLQQVGPRSVLWVNGGRGAEAISVGHMSYLYWPSEEQWRGHLTQVGESITRFTGLDWGAPAESRLFFGVLSVLDLVTWEPIYDIWKEELWSRLSGDFSAFARGAMIYKGAIAALVYIDVTAGIRSWYIDLRVICSILEAIDSKTKQQYAERVYQEAWRGAIGKIIAGI